MFDPLSPADLAGDELRQRRETGYDVADLAAAYAATGPDDAAGLEAILAGLARTERTGEWPYEEPDDWPAIAAAFRPGPAVPVPADLDDRILGGWLGRVAGCLVGKPLETGGDWTPETIRAYLEPLGAYPLRDYLPVAEGRACEPGHEHGPGCLPLHRSWPETTRGRVNGGARDDDIDYTILALVLLEQHGPDLSPAAVAAAWLSHLPYLQTYTAERAVYVNLLHGVAAGAAAEVRNPYREWIGALIRADAYGWVRPGRPAEAARLAYADAALSHRGNGVYGALWSAALTSCAAVAGSVAEAFEGSLAVVPPRSRLAEVLSRVARMHADGWSWDAAIAVVRERYGHYSWVHTLNNAAVLAAGLLWGEGDVAATIGLTVQGGWDTDSNGATAGSVAGTVAGAARLPPHLVEPLQDRVRSAVFGCDGSRISDLADRTVRLARGWPGSAAPDATR